MTEQQLNTIIGKSFDWYYKIGDAGRFKKPFDGVAVYKNKPVYWEAKMLQKPSSFNFNRLEDHQIENLLHIDKLLGDKAHTLLIFCVNFDRADKRIFVYNDMNYIQQRKVDKRSILKKEWLSNNNYVKIKKGLIDFEGLIGGNR